MKKPTRNDVAELARVSSATVSRVFNNPESVSADRREAVFEASEALGYSPDKSASALRRNGTGIITLVDIGKKSERYSWERLPVFKWFYSDVIEGIQKVVNKTMFQLNLESLDSEEEIYKLGNRCDGIIVFDVENHAEAEAVKKTGIPYILAHHTVTFKGYNTCSTDNFYGGVLQGEMLKKSGALKPVYISGFTDHVISHAERLKGFRTVYPDAALVDPSAETAGALYNGNSFEYSGDFKGQDVEYDAGSKTEGIGISAGRKAVPSIVEKVKQGEIDSIAVVNDYTAAGVYYELTDYGISVPEDVQIVSYDNMPFNSILPLPFATVDLHPSEIYEKAASLLINKVMKGKPVSETVKPFPVEGATIKTLLN